jgi:hypothetical protein
MSALPLFSSSAAPSLSPLGAATRDALSAFRGRVRRDKRHRYSVECPDRVWRRAPAVSAILANLEKGALVGWAARTQQEADMEAAFNIHQTYRGLWPRWKYEAVFGAEVGAALAHEAATRHAANQGSAIHAAIEADLLGQPHAGRFLDEHCRSGFEMWREWWATAGLVPIAVESPVALFEGDLPLYAGTFDLLAERTATGRLVLIDIKTGSIGYEAQRLQSIAYRAALRHMGITADIDGMLVKVPRVKDQTVETYEIRDDFEPAFECFRALATVNSWRRK